MEKDKTTRQRLEERFPNENTHPNISVYQMRELCLTASEELIEKEREETAIEFAEWIDLNDHLLSSKTIPELYSDFKNNKNTKP